MATISFCYAAYSLILSTLVAIRPFFVLALIIGNLIWALVCIGVILSFEVTSLGRIYVGAEAAFVAALAVAEWKLARMDLAARR